MLFRSVVCDKISPNCLYQIFIALNHTCKQHNKCVTCVCSQRRSPLLFVRSSPPQLHSSGRGGDGGCVAPRSAHRRCVQMTNIYRIPCNVLHKLTFPQISSHNYGVSVLSASVATGIIMASQPPVYVYATFECKHAPHKLSQMNQPYGKQNEKKINTIPTIVSSNETRNTIQNSEF